VTSIKLYSNNVEKKSILVGKKNNTNQSETSLGSKRVVSSDPIEALILNLISTSQKADASSIHIYSNNKSYGCFFEISSKLQPTGKNFNNNILEELLDFIKTSSNLEKSDLNPVQTASLSIDSQKLNLTYIQNIEDGNSHLIINLSSNSSHKTLEDSGFWGKSLEDLEEVLDYRKGIILIDSKDSYNLRVLINSCLNYLKQQNNIASVSFDSSYMNLPEVKNHDRIFTKVSSLTKKFIEQVITSNPRVVCLVDVLTKDTLEIAHELSVSGKLVVIAMSEGSVAGSLKRVINLIPEDVKNEFLLELKTVASISPIQTIASSNGNHQLDNSIISQLENFFGLELPESWKIIYSHAGIKSPEELLHLELPVVSEYGGVTNLVEVLKLNDYLKRTFARNTNLSAETLNRLALQSGMMSKREDGLIKALRKEVDLSDVIDICK